MTVSLCLFFHDSHPALLAFVRPLTLLLLMLYNFNTLNRFLTVDTRDKDIRTDSFVLVYLFPDTLCFTAGKSFAFDRLKLTILRVSLHLGIAQYLLAAKFRVFTNKLHVL
jgi:hypothetical protein